MRKKLRELIFIVALLLLVPVDGMGLDSTPYVDKNNHFQFLPPEGWTKKEYDDPRTKVSFDVPAAVSDGNKAGLFFLSHPLSAEVNMRSEAEDRVARLKRVGISDARVTTIEFAGVKAEKVEATLVQHNLQLRTFIFEKYGRIYIISFTATLQDFNRYWLVADKALSTFKCIAPAGLEVTTDAEQAKILKEKIRVWITALKQPDIGKDAYNSLLGIGKPAIPQLEEAKRSGTPIQRERAAELLEKIKTAD